MELSLHGFLLSCSLREHLPHLFLHLLHLLYRTHVHNPLAAHTSLMSHMHCGGEIHIPSGVLGWPLYPSLSPAAASVPPQLFLYLLPVPGMPPHLLAAFQLLPWGRGGRGLTGLVLSYTVPSCMSGTVSLLDDGSYLCSCLLLQSCHISLQSRDEFDSLLPLAS